MRAPLDEGPAAVMNWLGDGGFIIVIGAVVIGALSPKFLGK
jgi:hypothetical protein